MRVRKTPIPTPMSVRIATSVFFGLAVVSLGTALPKWIQLSIMIVSIAAGLLLIFGHPYRKRINAFCDARNISRKPNVGQVIPLFIVWLALMIVPAFAPLTATAALIVFLAVTGWMFWVFPHVDGTRKLAYADDLD